MRTRIELAKWFGEQGYTKGAEIGVCDGRYSKILYENIPDLQLIGVDAYLPYGGHGIMRLQSTHDDNMVKAHNKLLPHPNYLLVVGDCHETSKWIPDGSLDFVFIDCDHSYEHTKQDINDWVPKVRKGGVVSGHDYYTGKYGKIGVIQAVDEYMEQHQGYRLQTTEYAPDAYRDDRQEDWYFVK